jgi:hypothetical protein
LLANLPRHSVDCQAERRASEESSTRTPNESVQKRNPAVPRVTLTKREAAAALGISVDSFERHVQPDLRVVRRGRMRLIPLRELERWAADNAALTLSDAVR